MNALEKSLSGYEFWFLTGSQDLYGEETLKQVAANSKKIVEELNAKAGFPCQLVWKPTLLTPSSIHQTLEEANAFIEISRKVINNWYCGFGIRKTTYDKKTNKLDIEVIMPCESVNATKTDKLG